MPGPGASGLSLFAREDESMTANLLTTAEAARRLGLTRSRVIQLIHAGYIPAQKFSSVFMIPEDTLPTAPTWDTKPGPKPKG